MSAAPPLPRTDLSYDLCCGYAKSGVAIEHDDANLGLRNLSVEVPRHEALPHQFHTMHFGLGAAPSVVSAPSSADGAAEVSRCIDRLVPCDGSRACGLQGLEFLRGSVTAWAFRAVIASWHLRVP